MIDNKPFAAIATGAVTLGLGWHALDLIWAASSTIAVMALYWVTFDHEPHTPEQRAHQPMTKFPPPRSIPASTIEQAPLSTPLNPGAAPLRGRVRVSGDAQPIERDKSRREIALPKAG
jgi:hypothetical protein